jgi:hypothetical protein
VWQALGLLPHGGWDQAAGEIHDWDCCEARATEARATDI